MPAAAHRQTLADRIVLLIDLDCFYAQCECIRLGYDSTTTPLVLLQWNSVLAVTYPARELYNIKRGDGWDEVRRKSNGKCLTVHVPMLSHSSTQQTTSTATAAATSNLDNDDKDEPLTDDNPFAYDALDKKYDEIFKASDTDKEMARTELGVRRFSHEGKACIERYRIASRQIFSVILEYLGVLNKELKQKLVIERASIDELFFDVSGACFSDAIVKESDEDFQSSLDATKIIGQEDCEKEDDHIDVDAEEMLAFRRGIVLASRIRKHVRDKLNFTMTAGVGHNKTVAKLSATYGKPNGQAVTFPYAVKYLLSHTEIRKCRNFGGKLGKRVLALLPEGVPTTMGSIAQYLSLPELEKGLGEASLARWVYQAVRGTDTEAVVAKEQSLIKSITAFKSLPFHADGHTIDQAEPWIRLLAQEVVKRVDQDTERNNRYPKSLNIHFAAQGWGHHKTISIRIDFPPERLSPEDKIALLSVDVPKLITKKAGKEFKIHRIGLCAENFLIREKAGKAISAYFAPRAALSESGYTESEQHRVAIARSLTSQAGQENLAPLQRENKVEARLHPTDTKTMSQQSEENRDLELAKALQNEYDREQRMLETLERRDRLLSGTAGRESKKKRLESGSTKRIDSFFQKR